MVREGRRRRGLRRLWSLDDTSMGGLLDSNSALSLKSSATLQFQAEQRRKAGTAEWRWRWRWTTTGVSESRWARLLS